VNASVHPDSAAWEFGSALRRSQARCRVRLDSACCILSHLRTPRQVCEHAAVVASSAGAASCIRQGCSVLAWACVRSMSFATAVLLSYCQLLTCWVTDKHMVAPSCRMRSVACRMRSDAGQLPLPDAVALCSAVYLRAQSSSAATNRPSSSMADTLMQIYCTICDRIGGRDSDLGIHNGPRAHAPGRQWWVSVSLTQRAMHPFEENADIRIELLFTSIWRYSG
jgi:hypothetical protein